MILPLVYIYIYYLTSINLIYSPKWTITLDFQNLNYRPYSGGGGGHKSYLNKWLYILWYILWQLYRGILPLTRQYKEICESLYVQISIYHMFFQMQSHVIIHFFNIKQRSSFIFTCICSGIPEVSLLYSSATCNCRKSQSSCKR